MADYLEKNFRSPRLKNLLGARYGDYGLAPQDSSFMIHALALESYRKGAVYPEGGSSAIAEHCPRKLLNESDLFFFVSFPSLKKGLKQAVPTEGHCAEILTIGSPEQFAKWVGTTWKKRGKDYRALKHELENQLLEQVFTFYPQLREAIDYTEVSTPLSMEFFTQHPAGNMYGVPFVPGREQFKFCQAKTPYDNLFLSGQDVITLGIEGALMGGAFGAAISQGSAGFPALLKALKQHESASTAEFSSQQV